MGGRDRDGAQQPCRRSGKVWVLARGGVDDRESLRETGKTAKERKEAQLGVIEGRRGGVVAGTTTRRRKQCLLLLLVSPLWVYFYSCFRAGVLTDGGEPARAIAQALPLSGWDRVFSPFHPSSVLYSLPSH